MTAKCVGCGLQWNVSIFQQIPRSGYICPHCESKLRSGMTLQEIQELAARRAAEHAARKEAQRGKV